MKIRLDLIKPSPRPVRTSWDEDKMKEVTRPEDQRLRAADAELLPGLE